MRMSTPSAFVLSLSAAVVAASALVAAQNYPHAFPRKGVTQLFDTERVTVWEVNWINGVPQPIHRHRYDMAGVYLRYGKITVTTPEGQAATGAEFPVPRPYFQPKNITHKEEAVGAPGDPERLAIMVDLKDTTVAPFVVKTGMDAAFPRGGAKDVLDNPRVRMWDYTWVPGKLIAQHVHDTDTIEVFVDGGTIKTTTADGKEDTHVVAFKTARLVPRGRVDSEEAVSGSPRAIVIELKNR